MTIKFLKAFNGDSILISYTEKGKKINILIDGGMPATYLQKAKSGKLQSGELKDIIENIRKKKEQIDLLILTHVDDDHIGGILTWFENDSEASKLISRVWFNSGKLISEHFRKEIARKKLKLFLAADSTNTSIGQGVEFEEYISGDNKNGKKIWERKMIKAIDKVKFNGATFTFLAPDIKKLELLLLKWNKERPDSLETSVKKNDYSLSLKSHISKDKFTEDKAVHNGSSIAFIFSLRNKNFLFLGDAHPSTIVASLETLGHSSKEPLKVELAKLSHHGSKSNNSKSMLSLIDAKKFVISTNGDKHFHPNKQFLARLIALKGDCSIYFNYPELIDSIFSRRDFQDFPNFNVKTLPNNEFSFK